MHRNWLVHCWPGLPRIWHRGEPGGLSVALLFALLLNLAMATTLVWTELVSRATLWMLWTAVVAMWVLGCVANLTRRAPQPAHFHPHGPEDLFSIANREYLRGNGDQAEIILRRILAGNQRDAEARLLLASLLRRRGSLVEAEAELTYLERLEAGNPWSWEVAWEKRRLEQGRTSVRQTLSA
jgi:hypothetical protein